MSAMLTSGSCEQQGKFIRRFHTLQEIEGSPNVRVVRQGRARVNSTDIILSVCVIHVIGGPTLTSTDHAVVWVGVIDKLDCESLAVVTTTNFLTAFAPVRINPGDSVND